VDDTGVDKTGAALTPYPVGLLLTGRRVVVVGGGQVAQRRIPTLIAAGADVVVVSPEVTPAIEGLGAEIAWVRRGFEAADLDGAWYALAATDSAEVNEAVSRAAEERRVFCVRSDDGSRATAWTPAVGRHDGVTVAVLSNREPRRSAALRDAVVESMREGRIVGRSERTHSPGVTLVGGGPGDPELVTVAGRKALMEADVVVADRLAPRELLADLPADVELIDVAKLPRGRSAAQERSTGSSSSRRSPASGWHGSRAATTSSSDAATRRSSPVARRGCR